MPHVESNGTRVECTWTTFDLMVASALIAAVDAAAESDFLIAIVKEQSSESNKSNPALMPDHADYQWLGRDNSGALYSENVK